MVPRGLPSTLSPRMDALLKRLADVSIALGAAEEALDEGANTTAREHLDIADEGLAELREQWPQMDATTRNIVGGAAGPLRERADAARKRLPRFSALAAVEPTPEDLADEDDGEFEPPSAA